MSGGDRIVTRAVGDGDRDWIGELLVERWGATEIVTRGRVHRADALPGFIAALGEHDRAGLITYRHDADEIEIISLDSLVEGRGVGSALLAAVEDAARRAGARRVWLITTNDNLHAIRFYQRRGYRLAALHAGAIAESRRIKPSIPETGIDGIPIRDEIEIDRSIES
jgi:DNA-3-methyladenine glycosylase I